MPDHNHQYSLMDEEIKLFEQFQEKHKQCAPEIREAMLEENTAPTFHVIRLYMSTIGMEPTAHCVACGGSASIACEARINSY